MRSRYSGAFWTGPRAFIPLVSSPLKNSMPCRSRRKEAQIPSENQERSQPPHVGSYFFNGPLDGVFIALDL
jgi:hypothetical protein